MSIRIANSTSIFSHTIFLSVLEVAPLSLFLTLRLLLDEAQHDYWFWVYVIPSAIALPGLYFLLRQVRPLNRLLLGIDLYLVLGAIAQLAYIDKINDVYGVMEETALLIFMAAVGLFCVVRRVPFIALPAESKVANIELKSIALWTTSIAMAALSFWREDLFYYHEAIPFLLLFGLNSLLSRQRTLST
ncbi:MAG: hypothetical protein ACI9ON_000593 [Limisphaerales bacterium]|jgi:hypothetical protein